MANQGAQLILQGPAGRKSVRITVVDADGSAATFDDLGAASVWTADNNYVVVDVIGTGTTAPATATSLQPKVNQQDIPGFVDLPAVYDRDSKQEQRLGALLGARIKQGSSVQLIGRA